MNRLQMRQRVLRLLNDDPVSPVFFDPALVNQSLDDARDLLAEQAPLQSQVVRFPREAGKMLYALPALDGSIQVPYRFWLPDLHRRLQATMLTDLDARHELWMTVQGDPWCWFPVDWRTVGLWPVPGNGGWVEMDVYVWPTPLAGDTDEPDELSLSGHEALIIFAEMEGYLRQWDALRATERWQAFAGAHPGIVASADLQQEVARDRVRSGQPFPQEMDIPYGHSG